MAVFLRSGPADVVACGQTTTFAGHPLRLSLELADAAPISVELVFEAGPGPEVKSTVQGDGLRLVLTGFDGPEGRGTALPALLGEVGDDMLFLHFRVFLWGETPDRTVHWTIYRAPKAQLSFRGDAPLG